ncbi:30S ribosomal protein S6 [Runella rosea]|jgi:small subunit ribosomal protein S6|uniref:Small ribosomal subunit protein bS6 n=3 Tax=Runella TaxID=105 RepID=A0A344TR42_9BACT|nr:MULTISPECIES: 30S ribosomal protein S6 [Runella]AXE21113.1 30S ribosomal protein S6 [Runella rosea]MCP1383020.1 30S ribosomal protein S6 [Runella salmonicolor]NBB22072.1 30S ribosomal protein S6 [Runella sp. CRIBMP]RDB07593.1 30S ribosomal protein S6 [Runella aurantiaca]
MFTKQYEMVFILTPVLSDQQMKDTIEKFRKILTDNGAELVHEENWGLKKLAYPIQNKNTGFYHLIEFKSAPSLIQVVETEFRRDERVMRYLTVAMEKHHVTYAERKRSGLVGRKQTETAKEGDA